MFDKWMFALRNLSRLLERPKALQERVFEKFFRQAEIASYSPQELRDYEESVKVYRDLINVVDSAERRGKAEGKAEVARQLKMMGMPNEDIAKATGLTATEIDLL
jgi:predicted transposase/invertase (TIGR01784 family)